jgi:hypothetical protein
MEARLSPHNGCRRCSECAWERLCGDLRSLWEHPGPPERWRRASCAVVADCTCRCATARFGKNRTFCVCACMVRSCLTRGSGSCVCSVLLPWCGVQKTAYGSDIQIFHTRAYTTSAGCRGPLWSSTPCAGSTDETKLWTPDLFDIRSHRTYKQKSSGPSLRFRCEQPSFESELAACTRGTSEWACEWALVPEHAWRLGPRTPWALPLTLGYHTMKSHGMTSHV